MTVASTLVEAPKLAYSAISKATTQLLDLLSSKLPIFEALRRFLGGRVAVPGVIVALCLLNFENLPFMYHVRTYFYIFRGIYLYAYKKDKLWWFSGVPAPLASDFLELPRVTRRDESDLRFVATFASCDHNHHLNNGLYNTFSDFSRIDLYIRSGLGEYMRRRKLFSANGGVAFAYIKEIPLLTEFYVRSSVTAYDRKWMILQHRFETRDGSKVFAIGHSRIVFKEKSGKTVPPQQVLEDMRDMGILPGWGETTGEALKGMKLVPPQAQECCRAVMVAEKALELHALEEEIEHNGRGWIVDTADGGNERLTR